MLELLDVSLVVTLLAIFSLVDWRKGVLTCLLVGFLQDPLRKYVVGEPVAMQGMILVVAAATGIGALTRLRSFSLKPAFLGDRKLYASVVVFAAFICLQAVAALVRSGSPVVGAIGVIAYLTPLGAVWLGYNLLRNVDDIETFLRSYGIGTAVVAGSIFLSVAGLKWTALDQVGHLVVYDAKSEYVMVAHSGLMRTPEVASWHIAAGVCLLALVAMSTRSVAWRLWIGPLLVLLAAAGLFTARRKMLFEIVVFLGVFIAALHFTRQRRLGRRTLVLLAGAVVFLLAISQLGLTGSSASFDDYLRRGQTVFSDAPERLKQVGLKSAAWGVQKGGLLGLGAGVGSQGSQYFGAGAAIAGGGGEGGLGKIAVELGLVGLCLTVWVAFGLGRLVIRIVRAMQPADPRLARLTLGMVAFLVSNLAIYLVATQIYGDPFVLLMLGFLLGMVLAAPRLAAIRNAASEPTA